MRVTPIKKRYFLTITMLLTYVELICGSNFTLLFLPCYLKLGYNAGNLVESDQTWITRAIPPTMTIIIRACVEREASGCTKAE
jgi:hypothetical protein